MYTIIKIEATHSESSGYKKNKKAEAFRRFEFNHPLNPFRLSADETRIRLSHQNARDMNEGLISYFEKSLHEIQAALMAEKKDIALISKLTNDLYHEVMSFSTIPCTSNIDTSIFEHLNYILQLLYDWKDDAVILKEIEKDRPSYLQKVSQKIKVSTQEIEMKINHFNRKFIDLSQEILSEISIVKEAIQKAHVRPADLFDKSRKKD